MKWLAGFDRQQRVHACTGDGYLRVTCRENFDQAPDDDTAERDERRRVHGHDA